MRTDLTASFVEKMQLNGRKPRLLLQFHFKDRTVYVSDQPLGIANDLDNEYLPLVIDWGILGNSGDPYKKELSEVRQQSILLWNGGSSPFSDNFLSQDPEDVEVDLYQWFDDIAGSSKALIDRFVIQDPIEADEYDRRLRLDLVSLPMKYDGQVGQIVDANTFPDADPANYGRYLPVVLGDPSGFIPTVCTRDSASATLDGSILADTMSVSCNEDLDAEGFPASGTIQINSERMTYSSRTASTFAISQRGADGTTATEHLNQEAVIEHVVDFTFTICGHKISAVNAVKVGGFPAAAIWTAHLDAPARLVFTEHPYAITYAKGSSFLEMQFDAHDEAETTAFQPHNAYDDAAVTSAAKMSQTYDKMVLQQQTVNPDRGQIVKAYVAVEHWESGQALRNDRIKVSMAGTTLGYLTRPTDYDELDFDASVDIDHGHIHSITGEHIHEFYDPAFGTQESPHTHGGGGSTTVRKFASSQIMIWGNGDVKSVIIPNCPTNWQGATLHFSHYSGFPALSFRYSGLFQWVQGAYETTVQINPSRISDITIMFCLLDGGWPTLGTQVWDIYIDFILTGAIESANTGVAISKVIEGAQFPDTDKDSADVNDFEDANRSANVSASDLPTRTVLNVFDITSYVNFDWGYFTALEVTLEYEGTLNTEDIYILHAFFDIEYRKEQIVISDDVTVDVTGLVDDASGTVTGTPDAIIKRPDWVRKYLLTQAGGLSSDRIDTASMAAAGIRYAALAYEFNGIIDGSLTIREAEKKLSRQCRSRFFWDAGKAFTKVMERHADWSIEKILTESDSAIRLRGMRYARKPATNIINRIDLQYNRDWTAGDDQPVAYNGTHTEKDALSISSHKVRQNPDGFLFDLVTSDSMAADLAQFYIEDGKPCQYYTIEAFLDYFDLQKEDYIQLTHSFMSLSKAKMRVLDIERVFGNGTTKNINLLRLICEAWYRLILVSKINSAIVTDSLIIEHLFADEYLETVGVNESMVHGYGLTDSATLAESLVRVMGWAESLSEAQSVAESLGAAMSVVLSNSVSVYAVEFDLDIGSGFGLDAFGLGHFGSLNLLDTSRAWDVVTSDEAVIAEAAVLADPVSVAESLVFSSGFGSPWAEDDGFGETPFGS